MAVGMTEVSWGWGWGGGQSGLGPGNSDRARGGGRWSARERGGVGNAGSLECARPAQGDCAVGESQRGSRSLDRLLGRR